MSFKKIDSSTDNPIFGILLYSGAILFFALLAAAASYFSGIYPVNEIIFFRFVVSIIIILGNVIWKGNIQILKTTRPKMHFMRSLVGFSALTLLTLSYMELPLADASTIQYTSPFFVALFAWPILGERISIKQAIAICIGFLGIFFAFNPDLNDFNIGIVYGFLGTLFTSLVSIFLRDMGKTENPITTVLYFCCIGALISGCWLFFNWVTPNILHLLLFILLGVIAFLAQVFLTYAHKFAPASLLSPFNYIGIVWYTLLGYLIFNTIPTNELLIGCSLVIFSGLYIAYLEINKKKFLAKENLSIQTPTNVLK
jgi:drug/metabolite transporter (DMT)-like permease